jgi:translocation and assembly module TamB
MRLSGGIRRTFAIAAVTLGALVVMVGTLAIVFTDTDWGRERTRRLLLSLVGKSVHGILRVGELDGNLLQGGILRDVSLTDSAGEPFFAASEVRVRYALRPFIQRRLYFDQVTVVRPVILLNRLPGGILNFYRIFPRDSIHAGPPGFGSWIKLTHVTVVDGDVTNRGPWEPDSEFTRRQKDSVIAYELGPKGRQNIVRVSGGFQRIAQFHHVYATLPLLQLADPKIAAQTIDVASLHMTALPMRPPAVGVTDLRGRFIVLNDSVYFHGIDAKLTGSRLVTDGRYNISSNDLRLRLRANPIATNDLLWVDPDIPTGGTGKLDFALDWVGKTSDYQATHTSLRVAGATMDGKMGVLVRGDTMVYHDTDMRFARVDTRTIQQIFPTLRSPRQGFLTGRAAVAGSMSRLKVDADVSFDDAISGRSRMVAQGGLGVNRKGIFSADQLKLTLLPLRVALARVLAPTFPIGGTVTGTVSLNGSTDQRLAIQTDVTHTDTTGVSHVVGDAAYAAGEKLPRKDISARSGTSYRAIPWVNADLSILPLSLATVGRFAPAVGLQGTVAGSVRLTGPLHQMVLDATLTTPDSGSVTAHGTADLAAPEDQNRLYDVTLATHLFNANSVIAKAPRTNVTADASIHGHGTTLEKIDAVAEAHVKTSIYDSVTVDSAMMHMWASDGMLHVDTCVMRVPHGVASLQGAFGLIRTRKGAIRYTAAIDSLGALSRFFPSDTGVVQPRPGILAVRLQNARADSIRIARATEVQRAITGQAVPVIAVDTPKTVSRSALLGTLQTDGIINGNIYSFDVDGNASGAGLVALGSTAKVVSARYIWRDALTPQAYIEASLHAHNLSASGFLIDSVTAQGSYRNPSSNQTGNPSGNPGGTLAFAIWQRRNYWYSAKADYLLNHVRNDVRLNELRLQFDSTVYALERPASIHFGTAGVDADSIDIRANGGRNRIFLDSHLPTDGAAHVQFDVTNFDVGNLATLLESGVSARGLVSVDATLTGSTAEPIIHGAFGTTRVIYRDTQLPEVHGTLDYAAQTMHLNAGANLEGRAPFLRAVGTLPINLALNDVLPGGKNITKVPLVPTGRTLDVRIDADSLPLNHLPQMSDAVADLRGFTTLHAHVMGTIAHPVATGQLALIGAGMNIVPAGVELNRMNGSIRFNSDTIQIDSMVARSGGPIRLSGVIGIETLADPTFGLTLSASNARILGGDHGDLTADAALTLSGKQSAAVAKGQVRLLRGVVRIPEPGSKQLLGTDDPTLFSVLDTTVTENRDLFPMQSPLLKNLRANISVSIDRDVFVRSREANVEIYTEDPLAVTVNLRRQSFVVDGSILSDRGEYRFEGRRFMIQRGSATFINTRQLDPTLQVTGAYEVQLPGREPIVIQIVISGTLNAPKIALTSNANPPISQTDLLSYLAFGQSSSSLVQTAGSALTTGGSGAGNVVGRAAALAQQQLGGAALGAITDQVAGETAQKLGADVFDITPADVSSDVGNFLRATQIEFGKYIRSRTFVGVQIRPDPAALQRPGLQLQQVLDPKRGYSVTASFQPRYLLQQPSLSSDLTPQTTSVFGLFLMRQWRY